MKKAWLRVSSQMSDFIQLPSGALVLDVQKVSAYEVRWLVSHPDLPVLDDNSDPPLVNAWYETVDGLPKFVRWELVE